MAISAAAVKPGAKVEIGPDMSYRKAISTTGGGSRLSLSATDTPERAIDATIIIPTSETTFFLMCLEPHFQK